MLRILQLIEELKEARDEVREQAPQEVATAVPHRPRQVRKCRCGSIDFWLRPASKWGAAEWLCNICHPRPGATATTVMRAPAPLIRMVLGMTIDQGLELWRQHGAPTMHLSQGVNCHDLAKLLSRPDVAPEHLVAVKKWLQEHRTASGGG